MYKPANSGKKIIAPWTIYLWRNGDKIEGASPVVTRDGIKQIYAYGWEIEKVPGVKRNEDKHQMFRAKTQVKNFLNNTLNALNWYGSKILDERGDIDPKKFAHFEAATALLAVKQNVEMDDLYHIKKFPVAHITIQEAHDYGFVGNRIQNKFVDKHK